jgi:hypothetical protein
LVPASGTQDSAQGFDLETPAPKSLPRTLALGDNQ